MTKPDIIGIVKELVRYHYLANGGAPMANPEQAIQADYEYKESLLDNGCRIAQALLIAVEALEEIQNVNHSDEAIFTIKGHVAGALSRISSL